MSPGPLRLPAIPIPAWIVAGLVFFGAGFAFFFAFSIEAPPPWVYPIAPLMALVLAGYVLLIGYIHNDARRRGMRYVLWTWLVILIPNAIGIIIYFILRDPIPAYCTKCGAVIQPGFAFCPRCGSGIVPVCPQCHRAAQPGWSHCAWCGTRV